MSYVKIEKLQGFLVLREEIWVCYIFSVYDVCRDDWQVLKLEVLVIGI